jgi:hypothetical protein
MTSVFMARQRHTTMHKNKTKRGGIRKGTRSYKV